MFKIKILWDFDGTIFDTYPHIVEKFIKASGKELDEKKVLEKLKKDSNTAFEFFEIAKEQRGIFLVKDKNFSKEKSKPFEGIEEVLKSVEQNIIVTHRDKESTLFLLEKYDLTKYFKNVISVIEDGFPRKGHPASYLYAMERFGFDLVVGDRELDLEPARILNVKTVAFQNLNIQADYHIQNYDDFFKTIQGV